MTDEKKNAFTKDTIFSVTPAHLSKVNKITQAPPPIKPVSGLGLVRTSTNKPHEKQEVFIPVDGVELMLQWAVDWKCLFDLARQGFLIPDEPKHIQDCIENDFGMLSYYPPDEIEKYFSQWRYNPIIIEKLESEHPEIIEAWQKKVKASDNREQKQDATETTPAPQTGNYFKQNGKHWAIKFENEFAAHVDHVDGLLFIAHILNDPGNVISDQNLYNLAKGTSLNEGKYKMTISAAKADGLNIDVSPAQEVNDQKAQIEYLNKYRRLEHDLDNAESDLEKREIEDEMEKLSRFFTRRNIPKPEDKKAQANITRSLDRAYESIQRENMPELAKHLKDSIKTGDYGRRYVGPVVWVIEINK